MTSRPDFLSVFLVGGPRLATRSAGADLPIWRSLPIAAIRRGATRPASRRSPPRPTALEGVVDGQRDDLGHGGGPEASGDLGADRLDAAADIRRGVPAEGVVEPGDLRQSGRLAVGDPILQARFQVVEEVAHSCVPAGSRSNRKI